MKRSVAWLMVSSLTACTPLGPLTLTGPQRQIAEQQFSARQWKDAIKTCSAVLRRNPSDCAARYCDLLGQTMVFVDQLNSYIIPRYREGSGKAGLKDFVHLLEIRHQLEKTTEAADTTAALSCEFDLPRLPLLLGAQAAPLVDGEVRGRWTQRDTHLLGAIAYAMRYMFDNLLGHSKVPPPPKGETVPELPALLAKMAQHLAAQDRLLRSVPADPATLRGGLYQRASDTGPQDELLIDIFRPGTSERVFDFKGAQADLGVAQPKGALTETAALPQARCGYQRWHIDTLLSGDDVGSTDGMSFSPDGSKLVLPIKKNGRYQIHILNADGKGAVCLTCGAAGSSDGVRWQPGGDVLLFVSDRDHPYALGGAGGGAGQELYAMRVDGTGVTRLTHSHDWATNYHPNWSPDGKRVVWATTEERTWDVMLADFVWDQAGPRLMNVRRLTHDTTWWETHGFSQDGRAVITSNTRAQFLESDIYAIDIASGQRTRLTVDPAWDEHAHLSPDGRKLAWISGRWQPAAVLRLNTAGWAPAMDFFWIVPGIFFEFINHPAGYGTELTLMDADGDHVQRLTTDGEIVADNEWSPDGRRIVFRQVKPKVFSPGRIRVLTFDDCH